MSDIEDLRAIAKVLSERLDQQSRTPGVPLGAVIALIADPDSVCRTPSFQQVVRQGRCVGVHLGVPASGLDILDRADLGYSLAEDFSDPVALLTRQPRGAGVGMVGCYAISGSSHPSQFADLHGQDLVTAQWLAEDVDRRRTGRNKNR